MAIDKNKIIDWLWIPAIAVGLVSIKAIANDGSFKNLTLRKFPSKGKTALFVGDGHTFPNNGWVEALVRKAGFKSYAKKALNGGNTTWMLGQIKNYLATNKPDYIIVYGGANDAYANVSQSNIIANLQAMINAANSKGSKIIFVTGYNPKKVSYNFSRGFNMSETALLQGRDRWVALIDSMPKKLKDYAKVVPPYEGFTRANSTDGLHLTMPSYVLYGEWLANKYFGG